MTNNLTSEMTWNNPAWVERELKWNSDADCWIWVSTRQPKVIYPDSPHRVKKAA